MDKLWVGFLAVGSGSAIGGWARWRLSVWLNPRHEHFLVGTFAANAIGGFLVGLTTFSSFSAEVVTLIERGEPMWAPVVASSHLATSLVLTALGFWLYRQLVA